MDLVLFLRMQDKGFYPYVTVESTFCGGFLQQASLQKQTECKSTIVQSKLSRGRDFYKILNVPRNADISLIKKRYRQLSKELHPDTNPNASTQAFLNVRDAHEVLVNPETRKLYDKYGEPGLDPNFQPESSGGFPQNPFFFHKSDGDRRFFFTSHDGHPFADFFTHNPREFRHQRKPVADLFHKKSSVLKLNSHNWKSEVDERDWIAVVNFYSPACNHCVQFASSYESIATTFKTIFPVTAVNCRTSETLCHRAEIEEYPTLMLYLEPQRSTTILYRGGPLTETSVKKWLDKNIPLYGTLLTTANWERWMISGGLLPKVVLIVASKVVPLWYRSVAFEVQRRASLGYILLGNPSCKKAAKEFLPSNILTSLNHPVLYRITDIDPLEGEVISLKSQSKSITSLILSRIVASNKQHSIDESKKGLRQLTRLKYLSGECGVKDPKDYQKLIPTQVLHKVLVSSFSNVAKGYWVDVSKQQGVAKAFGVHEFSKSSCTKPTFLCPTQPAMWNSNKSNSQDSCEDPVAISPPECFRLVAYRPKKKSYQIMENTSNSIENDIQKFVDSIINIGVVLKHKMNRGIVFVS